MRLSKGLIVFGLMTTLLACKNEDKQTKAVDTSFKKTVKKILTDSIQTAISKASSKAEKLDKNHLETLNEDALNRISIPLTRNDSSLYLTAEMRKDHRIFGYAKPDKNSEKLITFSIFTSEVEGNPFRCKYGSYYDINKFNQKFSLKYKSQLSTFIATILMDSVHNKQDVYFEKKWIDIE